MGEAKRSRKKLDPNWGKPGKSRQNSEAGTTDDCHFVKSSNPIGTRDICFYIS